MKLSKIYANKDDIFKPIVFNEGFNVILGRVKKPKENKKDSHNLGKTLLIDLIDFLLLKGLTNGHFLYDHKDKFIDFEFYLEILLNSGKYVTIKRCVNKPSRINFITHENRHQKFTNLTEKGWTEYSISLAKAIEKLDEYLHLDSISPWLYRKGVSYFLRTQSDYLDVFQIGKFTFGEHIDWKPYLAKVLGFNDKLIKMKYEVDFEIESKEKYKSEYERTVLTKTDEYDKLKGAIEIKSTEINEVSQKLDKFDFYEKELNINMELVEEVELEISNFNNSIYNITYEMEKIKESLDTRINFKLEDIEKIFNDTKLYFPNQLKKSYEELVNFNTQIYEERRKHLNERLLELKNEYSEKLNTLKDLNLRREQILEILRGEDTFQKFKLIQKELVTKQTELVRLESQLETLDSVAIIEKEIVELKQKRTELVGNINNEIKSGNELYSRIRMSFNINIKDVLNIPALLSIKINNSGNLDFNADIVEDERTLVVTSEGKGTTYKKLLCASFDLAVLTSYINKSFFKFVYHDGILEGLDNRKKVNFLKLVRNYCKINGIQYILTVIDADLPRDHDDKKIQFKIDEIIRELHDEGDHGRLFNMPKF
jgi:uncharacterized protein YydD (DUF2326 family)